jgi:hypothetical protein
MDCLIMYLPSGAWGNHLQVEHQSDMTLCRTWRTECELGHRLSKISFFSFMARVGNTSAKPDCAMEYYGVLYRAPSLYSAINTQTSSMTAMIVHYRRVF